MGLRPGRAVRDPDKQSWTRYSRKKPRKSYIKSMPHQDITQFRMGRPSSDYNITFSLVAQDAIQVRDNALESARQTINKHLEKTIPFNFYFVVRIFPHQVIRENKMISGAGADRLQKGMRQSFGKPTDKTARLRKNQVLFTISTYKEKMSKIQTALTRALKKLPGAYRIRIKEETAA